MRLNRYEKCLYKFFLVYISKKKAFKDVFFIRLDAKQELFTIIRGMTNIYNIPDSSYVCVYLFA